MGTFSPPLSPLHGGVLQARAREPAKGSVVAFLNNDSNEFYAGDSESGGFDVVSPDRKPRPFCAGLAEEVEGPPLPQLSPGRSQWSSSLTRSLIQYPSPPLSWNK